MFSPLGCRSVCKKEGVHPQLRHEISRKSCDLSRSVSPRAPIQFDLSWLNLQRQGPYLTDVALYGRTLYCIYLAAKRINVENSYAVNVTTDISTKLFIGEW